MPISSERIQADLAAIRLATSTPGHGASRPTFSPQWAQAVDYVVQEARRVGCTARTDAAGNVHIRSLGLGAGERAWLSGSHLDSVPHGGDFDGVIGVLAPLEVLRAAQEDGQGPQPLELVIFAEEEGTTFGLGMLGSRTWAGTLAEQDLAAIHNEFGENYLLAGKPYGVLPERFGEERIRPSDYLGLIEIHIEQGPGMWNRNHPVALVTSISGRRQYQVGITGVANHAGSTSMSDRQDALAAAAEMCLAIEKLPAQLGKHVVATVGRLTVSPNAINVIPSEVQLTIDFRAPENGVLAQGDQLLGEVLRQIAARRKVSLQLEPTESLPAVQMSGDVCSLLRQGAQAESVSLLETVSGALHDSAILAPLLPTAMLFVASRDGISHNPAEHSRVEDIALATRILYRAVLASSAS